MTDKEFFDDYVELAAKITAANYDNDDDEPAYDPAFYDGFIAGVKWLMSRPFEQRMSEVERNGISKRFQDIEACWLSSLRNLGDIKLFFGALFNKEDGKEEDCKKKVSDI